MKPLLLGYDAAKRPVMLSPEDRRTHAHVIGSSGSGKSKFLEHLMRQDLASGQGFCLLDPHGSLYEAVLEFAARKVVKHDLVLLNLSKPDQVIGFNPFQRASGADLSVQVDRRVRATMHAWGVENTDQTPTLARTLWLIYAVMIEQNLGLAELPALIHFDDADIRAPLIERLSHPLIKQEWQELQRLKSREWRDETLSAKNRLFKFLTSETLGRVMGLPGHSISLSDIMAQGKVLLVNLASSDQLSHENARAFGALLVNEFCETALRRPRPQGRDPKPYYLYMDEFQNFVSLDIADMLDEVRKFGLFQILAHQRYGQLDENLIDAVLTNCRIKAVFGGLPVPSARRMAEELFLGELDPAKVKMAIYQTKFWPTYGRDKAYGTSRTQSSSHGSMESSGLSSMASSASGEAFTDWFGTGTASPVTFSDMSGSGSGSSSSSGSSWSESEATSESEIDIPIFIPVPFRELSSVQYYSLEEQLLELTAALKEQFPRHCFIKVHNQQTQPLLVPLVASPYLSAANFQWYREQQLKKQHALPAATVDDLLAARKTALLQTEQATQPAEPPEAVVEELLQTPSDPTTPPAPNPPSPARSRQAKKQKLQATFLDTRAAEDVP